MLHCRIKEGVLKEVLGILVSYRIVVKLIVGGLVSHDKIYYYSTIKSHMLNVLQVFFFLFFSFIGLWDPGNYYISSVLESSIPYQWSFLCVCIYSGVQKSESKLKICNTRELNRCVEVLIKCTTKHKNQNPGNTGYWNMTTTKSLQRWLTEQETGSRTKVQRQTQMLCPKSRIK